MPIQITTIAEVNAAQGFAPGEVAITSTGASVAWNGNTAKHAYHLLTEHTTLADMINQVAGEKYTLRLQQHASAAKTFGYGACYQDDTDMPLISTTLGAIMTFEFLSDGTNLFLEDYSVFESV